MKQTGPNGSDKRTAEVSIVVTADGAITFLPEEKESIRNYLQIIAAGEAARSSLSVLLRSLISRNGDPSLNYTLNQELTALVPQTNAPPVSMQ